MIQGSIISIGNLVKVYDKDREPALKGIDLEVPEGKIFGLLGPNGAGKTTTINIICGLLAPTSGKVRIMGHSWHSNAPDIRQIIGVVPQDIALYPQLTARENLSFIGAMYGLKGKQLRERIDRLLNLFGLQQFSNRQISTYSGGMKRRANLIAGILHNPRILFLDEPTVGIDVQSRSVILDHLRQMNKEGTTIIYTSHYMEEAEGLCSAITIIDHGRVIAEGHPKELIGQRPEYINLESIFLHLTGRSLRDQ